MVGIFNSIDHAVPPNSGSYRRIRIHLREGCVVGIPRHPSSCSVATTNLGDRVTCAVQRALAEIDERAGMADGGAALPPAAGVVSGCDPRAGGAPFCNELILGAGAGPGNPASDGWLTMTTMGNAGMPFIDSIEVDEIHHPILISERRIICDGEGAGRMRGAPGSKIAFAPLGCTMEVGYVSDGTLNPAQGARGGLSAQPARQFKERSNGEIETLGISAHVTLHPGERIISFTAGGGGFGPPLEREPARVQHDVDEGWISPARAREIYGVVLDRKGEIDAAATLELRAQMRRSA
jgi:N-methylhydantoinase B